MRRLLLATVMVAALSTALHDPDKVRAAAAALLAAADYAERER